MRLVLNFNYTRVMHVTQSRDVTIKTTQPTRFLRAALRVALAESECLSVTRVTVYLYSHYLQFLFIVQSSFIRDLYIDAMIAKSKCSSCFVVSCRQ